MSMAHVAVFGIYSSAADAERGVDHLIGAGFNHANVSVLLPDDESTRAFAYENTPRHPKAPPPG